MDMKKIYIKLLSIVVIAAVVSACYKEDVNVLYSRQYVIAENIKGVNERIKEINKGLAEIRTVITLLEEKEPITSITYDIVGNDTLGAKIVFGSKEVYIPFGRDGVSPIVSIDKSTGFWLINGVSTGVLSTGRDGKTPKVSAKQDPNNLSDENFYWTISFDGEEPAFMLDPNGNKIKANGDQGKVGPEGPKGEPGINSPIKNITVNADNSITIHTDLPLGNVTIPLLSDTKFIIHPNQSLISGTDASSRYNSVTNSLLFSDINESIDFPFEKSDELLDVNTSIPRGWSYSVDQAQKRITITSPKNGWNNETPHDVEAVFFARNADGNTYSRTLKLKLASKVFVNYFLNDDMNVPVYRPATDYNNIGFSTNNQTAHISLWFLLSNNGSWTQTAAPYSYESGIENDADLLKSKFKGEIYRSFDKPETMDEQNYSVVDFIFDPNYISRATIGDASNPANSLIINSRTSVGTMPNTVYQEPVPWDTYLSYNPLATGVNTDKFTLRLRRATQRVELYIKNPKQFLGLTSSDNFDVSKLTLKIPTGSGMRNYQGMFVNNKLAITKVDANSIGPKGQRYINYNSTDDMLTASFATFLSTGTLYYAVLVEYTKTDGTVVKKRIGRQGNHAFAGSIGGSILSFKYNIFDEGVQSNKTFSLYTPGLGTRTGSLTEVDDNNASTPGIRPPRVDEMW